MTRNSNLTRKTVNRSISEYGVLIFERAGKGTRWVLIKLIRFYQLAISPHLGSSCRHSPTCSSYMIEAIREWGALRGTWMGLKRLGQCHPWGTYGYDPVPRKKDENGNGNDNEEKL